MTADAGITFIRSHNHCQCIPANDAANLPLHEHIAWHALLVQRRDCVAIGRNYGSNRNVATRSNCFVIQLINEKVSALNAFFIYD